MFDKAMATRRMKFATDIGNLVDSFIEDSGSAVEVIAALEIAKLSVFMTNEKRMEQRRGDHHGHGN